MSEQRRATSVLIVSDFMNQVGALSVSAGSADERKFDQMLVARSQLLLNTLSDSDLKAQIVQYLASGGFNRVFATIPFDKKPTLNLKGVALDRGDFSSVDFGNATSAHRPYRMPSRWRSRHRWCCCRMGSVVDMHHSHG